MFHLRNTKVIFECSRQFSSDWLIVQLFFFEIFCVGHPRLEQLCLCVWCFRLELLLQRANKVQNMALECEEKLTLAKNTLQAVSTLLMSFKCYFWWTFDPHSLSVFACRLTWGRELHQYDWFPTCFLTLPLNHLPPPPRVSRTCLG